MSALLPRDAALPAGRADAAAAAGAAVDLPTVRKNGGRAFTGSAGLALCGSGGAYGVGSAAGRGDEPGALTGAVERGAVAAEVAGAGAGRADDGDGAAAGACGGAAVPGFVARVPTASRGAVTFTGCAVAGRAAPPPLGGAASGTAVDGRSAAGATTVADVRGAGTGSAGGLLAVTAAGCVTGSDGVDGGDPACCRSGDSAVSGAAVRGIATGVAVGSVFVARGVRADVRCADGVGGVTFVVAAESGGVAGRGARTRGGSAGSVAVVPAAVSVPEAGTTLLRVARGFGGALSASSVASLRRPRLTCCVGVAVSSVGASVFLLIPRV